MEADAKYTYVGMAVIALLMAVVVGVIWLKRSGRISDFNFYTVYFEKQNLDGLQIGADVSMRGIKVGRVEDYALTPDNINRVRALLRVDRRTPVSTNTVAVVNRRFVTGLAKIDLETGDPPGPPLEIVLPNENYPVIPEGTSNLDEIANRLNKVGETAAETLERLNDVLKPENRAAIEKTLANLRDLTGGLNQRLAELDRTLKSVQGAADNLGRASNSVTTFANNTDRDLQPVLQQAETDAEGHLGRHDRARKAGQLSVAGGRVHRQLERRPADRGGGRTAGDRRHAEPPAWIDCRTRARRCSDRRRRSADRGNDDAPPLAAACTHDFRRACHRLRVADRRQGHAAADAVSHRRSQRRRRRRLHARSAAIWSSRRSPARRSTTPMPSPIRARTRSVPPTSSLRGATVHRAAWRSCWSIGSLRAMRLHRSRWSAAASPARCSSIFRSTTSSTTPRPIRARPASRSAPSWSIARPAG